MRFSWSACLVILAFTSSGCFLFNEEPTTEELENLFDNEPYETVVANFDPLNAVLPYPYNLLFAAGGNEPDGSLDIPVVDPTDFADPAVALNTLDG
ncbi:MAG: hypothetical protein VX834_12820, partial [Myxococcota bacterium]|nr:hypothetical protein [Myxococcota bacterium]